MSNREETAGLSLLDERERRKRKAYAALVLKVWDDQEHAEKRAQLDRKAEVQIKARERL